MSDPRLELVVRALVDHRLATYRANVLSLADRIGVDSAQQLRNLLEEQEARLRNAGPSIRDYAQARAVLEALDADRLSRPRAVAPIAAELDRLEAAIEELEGTRRLLAWHILDQHDGEIRVTEQDLERLDARPVLEVFVVDDTRDRVIRARR